MAESKEALDVTMTSIAPFEGEHTISDIKLFKNDGEFKAFIERLRNSSKLKTLNIYLKPLDYGESNSNIFAFDNDEGVITQETQSKILHGLELICQTVKANKVRIVLMDIPFSGVNFSFEFLTIFRNLVQNEKLILSGSLDIADIFACNEEFFAQYAALLNNTDSSTTVLLAPYFKKTLGALLMTDQLSVRLAMLIEIAKQTKLSFKLKLVDLFIKDLSRNQCQHLLKSFKDLVQVTDLSFDVTDLLKMENGGYEGIFDWLPNAASLQLTFSRPPADQDLKSLTKYLQQSRTETVKFLSHNFFNVVPECFQEFINTVLRSPTIESVTLDEACPASDTKITFVPNAHNPFAEHAVVNFRKMCEILSTDSRIRKLHILGINVRGLQYLPDLLKAIMRSTIRVLALQNIFFNPHHGDPYVDEYGSHNNGIDFSLNDRCVRLLCELTSRMTTLHELDIPDINKPSFYMSFDTSQLLESLNWNVSLLSFRSVTDMVKNAMKDKIRRENRFRILSENRDMTPAEQEYHFAIAFQNKIDEILLINRHRRLIWAAYALCRAPICNKSKLPDTLKDLILSFLDGREQQFKEKQKTYRQKHPNSNVLFHYGRITASAEAKWGAKTSASDKSKDIEHDKGKRRGVG